MTYRASRSLGTRCPRSRQAAWSAPAIHAAESIRVPSQSNTSKSNRLGMRSRDIRKKLLKLQRKRRAEGYRSLAHGMRDGQFARVQKHPLQTAPRERPIELEVAVFVVAGDWITQMSKMNADLVSAAGLELRLEQTETLVLAFEAKHRMS